MIAGIFSYWRKEILTVTVMNFVRSNAVWSGPSGPSRSNWSAQSDAFLPADIIRVDFLDFYLFVVTSQTWWWWFTDINCFRLSWTVLRVFCSVTAKFSANRVCQVENVQSYPHHHRIHPLLPFYIFFCVFLPLLLLFLLIPIFLGNFISSYLRLDSPIDLPIFNSARQDRQTPWWALGGSGAQAQRLTCGTNRRILHGCVKKVGVWIYYRYTM